ncbi:hypothetical protein ACFWFI_25275 [Streptomyces sp. NPDC060209]|uniref:hypothetical protein n=1 Tax=Streptomyces sp. NPDC060209 TaxID=3347073 RepID=UPI00365F89AC
MERPAAGCPAHRAAAAEARGLTPRTPPGPAAGKIADAPSLVIAAPAWTAFVAHPAHPTASSVG